MSHPVEEQRYRFLFWPPSVWGRLAMALATFFVFTLISGYELWLLSTAVWAAIVTVGAILGEIALRFQYVKLLTDELYLRNASRVRKISYTRIDSIHVDQKRHVEVWYQSTTSSGVTKARKVHLRPERVKQFETELRTPIALARSERSSIGGENPQPRLTGDP